jgi:hypothetical protein
MRTQPNLATYFLPVKTNVLSANTRYNPLKKLRLQWTYWTEEVNFYHRLLSWSLLSCADDTKNEVRSLLYHLSQFRDVELPVLKADLEALNRNAQGRPVQMNPELNHFTLQNHFERVETALLAVKQQIFQCSNEFIRVRIW